MSDLALLAGRRLWIGIPGLRLDDATRRHLEDLRPGGIVLFGRNVESREQVRELISELRALLGEHLRVSVDQEGGLVVRFARELAVFPGNMALGAAAYPEIPTGEHLAERQGFLSAAQLRALGIDVNLAPVLDLMVRGGNPGIGTRSFGEHRQLASRLGTALVRGTLKGGVLPTAKHFPGKGAATLDAHLDLPTIRAHEDQEPHLEPFIDALAAGCPIVMTSHVIYEALDPGRPATFSRPIVTELLRGRLGFSGVAVTDDLEMGAMIKNYPFAEIVREASRAGHDVFCIAHRADRQREAFDVLREGLEQGEEWAQDPNVLTQRLDALSPTRAPSPPSDDEANALAEAIAGRAVTIIRDDRRLLPLREQHSVLLALPFVQAETGVEDPLRGEDPADLAQLLPGTPVVHRLPHQPTEDDVRALLERATSFDRLLVITTLARFDPSQAALTRACAAHPGFIHLPLRNPFDCEVLHEDTPFTAVTPFGFRPVHLIALAKTLSGAANDYGRLPVTLTFGARP